MPAKRRRTLSRNPFQRLEMWDKKMNPSVYSAYLEATKPLAIPKVGAYQVTHESLISLVRSALSGFPSELAVMQQYMWFAEKLWKLSNQYKGNALQKEADALYLWHLARGGNDLALRAVAKALGIIISSTEEILERAMAPLLLKVLAEGSVTADGSEQTILDYRGLAMISGYIDLSSMEEEDEIVVRVYTQIESGGEFKLYRQETIIGKQIEPALYVLSRLSAYGFRVTVQQTKGSYKTFKYVFVKGV
ncbi:MAG: hypothetical protein QXH20_06845 [Candidatus Bathyarchaeia archaeon]